MPIEDFYLLFLELLAGFSAIMIGLLFLTVKSNNRIANVFLVVFLWCLAWLILTDFFLNNDEGELIEIPIVLEFDPVLFLIPSLFLYIIITINKSFNGWYLLLFLPGVVTNIFHFEEGSILDIMSMLSFPVINIALMIIAFRVLIKHKRKIKNYYSELENKTLSWIKSIIITVFILHFFLIFTEALEEYNNSVDTLLIFFEVSITVFMVYWIGYNGFFQAQLFRESVLIESPQIEEVSADVKTEQNVILDDDSRDQFKELVSKITSEKLFQNPKLNLRTLSINLDIKEKELSKLINQCSKTNFYQFINHFRVDEFKNLIQSPKAQQLSILGLAEEAGFSSKSTFYTAFKSLEGITPKQYEDSLKKSE